MDQAQVREMIAKQFAPKPVTPPGESLKKLLENFELYTAHMHGDNIPFEVGEIVTPREGTVLNGAGDPHIILDVYESEEPLWSDIGRGTMADGTMPNMRVGVWAGDHMLAFWVESWMFERWEPKPTEEARR